MKEPSVPELRALAEHAARRASVYRRRVYLGRGDPRELAELERIADGAVARLHRSRRALADSDAPHERGDPEEQPTKGTP